MTHIPQLLRLAGVVCAVLVGNGRLLAQPSVMWTASEATRVMSGPADSYYPVLTLPRGTELEVHQRLDSGWLAVRPPEGSYSLISATAIESVDYRTARITREGAASRVGSALVDDASAVHVRLQLGELVEVLDPTADPISHLVRIAPPAGEFRWVKAEDVSERPIAAAADTSESTVELPAAEGASTEAPTLPPTQPPAAEPIAPAAAPASHAPSTDATPSGQWRGRTDAAPSPATPQDEQNIEVVRFDSAVPETQPAATTIPAQNPPPATEAGQGSVEGKNLAAQPASPPAPAAHGAASTATTTAPSFATQIDMLEIQLSRRIAGPANLWVFDDLEKEAARLAGQTTHPEQVTHLRELSTRMARFSEIASRHRAAATGAARGGAAIPADPSVASAPPAIAATAQGYDAMGILRPVVSRRAGAPPYALVDDKGEVITFVTPGPSVNLQAYLGQRVAVSGTRAYLPAYRRRNIQTARVQPITPPATETRTR